MDKLIYLDHNATTPTDPRVLEEMLPYFNVSYYNPSSLYKSARDCRKAVEQARDKVASLLGAEPCEIAFTAGGTEANNFAIKGIAFANKSRKNHIITSKIEHHAVLVPCIWLESQGFEVTYLGVDKYGVVDLNELKNSITDHTVLITVMHANNEIGTIQPIKEIAELAHSHNIYFHTDAVQTVGKLPTQVQELGVGLLSLSGHKFYGPKGVGALYIKKGTLLDPLIHGGHHERDRRAGTENVPGIVGLGKACEIAQQEMGEEDKIKELRDRLWDGIKSKIPEVVLNGHPEQRLASTLSICVKYVEGESMLMDLDAHGICASSGSACAAGTAEPSHVLTAIGIPADLAHSSLRISLGKHNTKEEIEYVLKVFPQIIERLRALSPFWKK
ncbi:cysteine desulfurase NifS [candidate division WOR-3 bacterium]|nr:cysteine desulfurase NifS [candidate division WOR-3 bacterium]